MFSSLVRVTGNCADALADIDENKNKQSQLAGLLVF